MSDEVITDDMEIIRIFMEMKLKKERLWVWQKELLEDGNRPVHLSTVNKIDQIKRVLELRPTNTGGYKFVGGKPVFVFSENRTFAFVDSPSVISQGHLSLKLPKELKIIKGDFLLKLQLVERENESANLEKREAPRVVAKAKQVVSIRRFSSGGGVRHPILKFELYDVSSGGLSFIIDDPAEFEKGEELEVLRIDKSSFKKDLIGIVRSIREMEEEENKGIFKIGVQFLE